MSNISKAERIRRIGEEIVEDRDKSYLTSDDIREEYNRRYKNTVSNQEVGSIITKHGYVRKLRDDEACYTEVRNKHIYRWK